jgi:hypothetical protein
MRGQESRYMGKLPLFMGEVPDYQVVNGHMEITVGEFALAMPVNVFLAGCQKGKTLSLNGSAIPLRLSSFPAQAIRLPLSEAPEFRRPSDSSAYQAEGRFGRISGAPTPVTAHGFR